MKKMNNKGFTVVELTLSFLFVFTLAFSMYQLLFNYRTRQNEESIKSQLIDYSNQVTLAIQNDINEKTLKNIEYCTIGDSVIDRCLLLNFNDNTSKQLAVEKGVTTYEGEQYEINYITYGGIIYESSDAILLDYRPNYMLYNTYESDSIEDSNVNVYKISIPIYHNDLEGNYGIEIVAVGYNYEGKDTSSGGVDSIVSSPAVSQNIAIYSATDNSLTFTNISSDLAIGDTYNGKVVTDIFVDFEKTNYTSSVLPPWYSYRNSIKKVEVLSTISPISMTSWFSNFTNCSYFDVGKIDTSNITNMSSLFSYTGSDSSISSFQIVGLDKWDTSNVTKMDGMFNHTAQNATTWSIGDLSNWNTSKVTDISMMFQAAAQNATTFNIGNLKNWNTSNITDMSALFYWTGNKATTWSVGDLSTWNTSKVTRMDYMFGRAGEYSTTFNIGNIGKWDISNVKNMYIMFFCAGATTKNFYIGDLSSWNTSKVTNMNGMFQSAGKETTTFNIGNLGSWNTSNVTDMTNMFTSTGYNSTTFYIGDLSGWNTSNVTKMGSMFYQAGYKASWSLDCSSWDVSKVTNYSKFNEGVEGKVTAPTWKN